MARRIERSRSPVDFLGYRYKCCYCIPLRAAVIIICMLSFIWGAIELACADNVAGHMFKDKDTPFKVTALVYSTLVMMFLFATGLLMLGIIFYNYKAIFVYIWIAFLFNCAMFVFACIALSFKIYRTGVVERSVIIKIVLQILWHAAFFYFLVVVNTLKACLLYIPPI
ncbi:uncharacterized protein LOC142983556 isoform X2 [Anticarsia gemmatalis]